MQQINSLLLFTTISLLFLNIYLFIFLTVLSLSCCSGFSLVAAGRSCSVVAVCRLLVEAAPLVEPGL